MPPVKHIVGESGWLGWALRHFTTIIIIFSALWWLAMPRVEAFIREVVNDRIERIEVQLDQMQRTLVDISRKLDEKK